MKKIIISGGSGFIGKNLSKYLSNKGYEINILTRNTDKCNKLDSIKYHKIDFNSIENTAKIIEGAYSIINLSGASIVGKKWSSKYKQEIYNSRINTSNFLVKTINSLENPPKSFINASAIGIYGNCADEILDENSKIGKGFLADVCKDWEYKAEQCNSYTRVIKARIGIVLSNNGGALAKFALPFHFLFGGPIGNGKQWMSWIHIEDLLSMFLLFIEDENLNGTFNIVAPNPVTMNEFAKTLGNVLRKPSIFRVPEFIIKMVLGESSSIILDSQRVLPKHIENYNFKYKFSFLNKALIDLFLK